MGKYIFILLLYLTGLITGTAASCPIAKPDIHAVIILKRDTAYMKVLPQLNVYSRHEFKNNRQRRLYSRLIRDVRVTLPYAKQAANILNNVNDSLQHIKGEKAKKEYLKDVEKDLFSEFEQPLRKLSYSQGRLLIKLVDRECQQNSYELVKLYRGGLSAFFWQGIARIFGANLKAEYDAKGEDLQIEQIVRLVERGLL